LRGDIIGLIATILSLSPCSRTPEHRARAAAAPTSSAAPAELPGCYLVRAETLERFIRYQEHVLALEAEMAAELSRTAAVAPVIRKQVDAEDRIRRELGLTERDVEELEAIAGDVISRRARLSMDDARQTLREMEALAARLPMEERAEFDATLAALSRQLDDSRGLAEERERYGVDNVERVLAREAELTDQWNRAIAVFSGIAPLEQSSATSSPAESGAAPDVGRANRP